MSERALIAQTVARLLAHGDLNDPRAELWEELARHGIVHPFHAGLSRWSDAGSILSASARFAPALPIAENVLASYFLQRAGRPLPSTRLTVCDPKHSQLVVDGERVSGSVALVPFAAVSTHAVALARVATGPVLTCFELRGVEALPGENLAFEPRDTLRVTSAPAWILSEDRGDVSELTLLGALARSTQLAYLSEHVLGSSIDHARTRQQFGRAVADFQAVRHALARLAEAVAVARCAIAAAEAALDVGAALSTPPVLRAVARAHIESQSAARAAIRHGHALHAALGFSFEHHLHRFTTRLMSYRAEFDAPAGFAHWLGRDILGRGAAASWDELVSDA